MSKGYYGATVAAPVFQKIAKKINAIKPRNIEVAYQKESSVELKRTFDNYAENLKTDRTLPNVKGLLGMDAVALLENLGYEVKYSGKGKVVGQVLVRKSSKTNKARVLLKLQST